MKRKSVAGNWYWDSGVFVAYLNDEEGRADIVEELLEDAQDGKSIIITSTFALVEVLKVKGQKALSQNQDQMIVDMFEYPCIRFVEPDRNVCEEARRLIWNHPSLKPKDAVHLASALAFARRLPLSGLFSYDDDFLKLNGIVTNKFPIVKPVVKEPLLIKVSPSKQRQKP